MAKGVALAWDLIARDGASPTFLRVASSADKAAAATSRAQSSILGFGKKTAAALGAIVSIDFAAHMVKDAAKFQQQMLLIQTLTGATAAEVKNMSAEVLKLSGQVGQAPEELATSLYHVESIGLRGAEAMDVVKIAAQGAKVGMADLEETTNALTSTVASGIPGVTDMSQAMGALVTIVGAGDMKMSDLNEALGGGILAVVKGYGLSLNDVGAALATFGDNNIRGADAATALRMAVQSLAVPAAKGAGAIEDIGLTMHTLQIDMQKGGLNSALIDLNEHLKAAGITGVQVGGYLTEAFGKRAGIGLSVLMGQFDRFQQKVAAVREGADRFGSSWEETTHNAQFAFDQLRAKFESFSIAVGSKLLPAVTDAATWLGTNVPAAAHRLADILGPLAHIVAVGLVDGFTVLSTVASATAAAFGAVGRFAAGNTGVITDMGEAVLALWIVFKGYTIAVAAFKAIQTAIILTRVRLLELRESGALAAGGLVALGVATYAVGKGISKLIEGDRVSQKLGNWTQNVENFRDALVASNGAITDSIRLGVAKQLQDSGLADRAHKAGISTDELTKAVTGTDAATLALIDRWKASGKPAEDTIYGLMALHAQYRNAAGSAKDLASVTTDGKKATEGAAQATGALNSLTAEQLQFQKDLARAQKESQITIGDTTYAFAGQKTAVDLLNGALDKLSGRAIDAMEAELQLKDTLASGPSGSTPSGPAPGVLTSATGSASAATNRHARAVEALAIAQRKYNEAVKGGNADTIAAARLRLARAQDAVAASTNAMSAADQRLSGVQSKVAASHKKASASLDENTAAGRKNIEWLLSAIKLANDHADRVAKQTGSLDKAAAALKNDEAQIRSSAAAHGIYGKALDDLLKKTEAKPGDLLKVIKAQADTAGTAALTLQKKLDNLTHQRLAVIKIGDRTGEGQKHIQDQLDELTKPRVIPISFRISASDLKARVAGAIVNGIGLNAGGTESWRGGPTWVGEQGPELLNLPRGSRITSHPDSMKAVAGGGDAPHIHVDKMELHVHYPEPGGLTEALPNLMRAAASQFR